VVGATSSEDSSGRYCFSAQNLILVLPSYGEEGGMLSRPMHCSEDSRAIAQGCISLCRS